MTMCRLFVVVLTFDVLGAAAAVTAGGAPLSEALLVGTAMNAPFTFVTVQAATVAAATRWRAGAALLTLLCLISLVSGIADGSYAESLAAGERAIQVGLVGATALLLAAAARAAARRRTQVAIVG